jgi:hypothetical protein
MGALLIDNSGKRVRIAEGRPWAAPSRKVRAPQGRVPANGRASRGDGKCNREETADDRSSGTGKGETVV